MFGTLANSEPYIIDATGKKTIVQITERQAFEAYQKVERMKAAAKNGRRKALRESVANIRRTLETSRPPSLGALSGLIPTGSFGKPAWNQVEVIAPGAFSEMLASGREIPFLVGHDRGQQIARRGNGSLRLTSTAAGLRFEADVPATERGADLAQRIEAGEVAGVSFWINARDTDSRSTMAGGVTTRFISRLMIDEISLVMRPNSPAYPQTADTLFWKRR